MDGGVEATADATFDSNHEIACSTQSDPDNCGECGRSCHGMACAEGACLPQVLFQPPPAQPYYNGAGVIVADHYVVWDDGPGHVNRVDRDGGPTVALAESLNDRPTQASYADGTVFWADKDSGNLRSVPLAGGTTATLSMTGAGSRSTTVQDGEPYVYVANQTTGQILRVSRSDGTIDVVAPNESDVVDIRSDATYLAWSDRNGGAVRTYAKATGQIATLGASVPGPTQIAIQDGYVYWAYAQGDKTSDIVRAPAAGGGMQVLAHTEATKYPVLVATDGEHVYWTTDTGVYRAPVAGGGTPLYLAPVDVNAGGIAVDDLWVYYVNAESGVVVKVAK